MFVQDIWGDAKVLVHYGGYITSGDDSFLSVNYEMMKK